MAELKEAFNVLTTPRRSLVTAGHDPVNLLLILHSLVLTCNRYPDALSLYEFDEYKLLLELLASHCTAEGIRPTDCSDDQVKEISVCAAELLFNTCAVSVINGDVLLQQKDLGVLERVVNFCVGKMLDDSVSEQVWVLEVCLYILQTITGLSASPRGREWISGTTTLASDMVTILWFWHHSMSKTIMMSKLAQQVLEGTLCSVRYCCHFVIWADCLFFAQPCLDALHWRQTKSTLQIAESCGICSVSSQRMTPRSMIRQCLLG